ncbi:MAG TPA: TonB-dependent receptor [Solimonas sp.]
MTATFLRRMPAHRFNAISLPRDCADGHRLLLQPLLRPTTLALATLAFPAIAFAEDAPATQLDTIVVQANPFNRTTDELIQPVDVIAGEELERRRRGTIGDALDQRPGIASASFGPGVGRPVIRGQGGPRVQIMDNGIGSMDASSISADHAVSVDPLLADQIEVIKGPATLIYGGGASAGVVNVVDDRLPDTVTPGLRVRGDASYGSNADETNVALRSRYGVGDLQFGAHYTRRNAGTFKIPGNAERGHDDEAHGDEEEHDDERRGVLENSDLRTQSYGASMAWAGARGMLGAAVSRFETNYGIPGHAHEHGHEEAEEGEAEEAHGHDGVRVDLEQTRVDLRGLLNRPFAGFDRLEARVGINDYRHRELEPDGAVGTTFDVQERESRIELEHLPVAGWTGVVGVHLSDRDFEAIGEEAFVPPVRTRGLGLFWVEGRDIGEHHIELGARLDQVDHTPGPGTLPNRDFQPLSLSAGAHLHLAEHLHLRVNAQSAQRAPAPEELYAFGPHLATLAFERGNPSLDVETANNLDVTLSQDAGRWTWEASVFYNRINDYVFLREVDAGLNADGAGSAQSDGIADRVDESGAFDPDGELLLLDAAQRDAVFYGAELSARYRLIAEGPLKLNLRGFADMVRGQLKSDADENLPRITPSRFGLALEGRRDALAGSLNYTHVLAQDRFAPLETRTPGYDLVSADLRYRILAGANGTTTLYVMGRNLLDEEQRLATSFLKEIAPQPGRSIFVGVRFDFTPPSDG